MPELPDLQVFSRNLNKTIVGKTVKTITVPVAKKLNVTAKTLKARLEGQKLTAVERVGKELQFTFKSGDVLALHPLCSVASLTTLKARTTRASRS